MNKRDFRIDIVRAICAIEIIAFWHLMDYLPNYYSLSGMPLHTAKLLTDSSMATFAFISGFCLSKYDVNTKNDAMYFYKRRLKVSSKN